MSYLKGGSVVDGNLYVEGDLLVKGVKSSTENSEFAYIILPGDIKNHIPLIDEDGDGRLSSSGLVVDGNSDPQYLIVKVDPNRKKNSSDSESESEETTSNESGFLFLDVYSSRIKFVYKDNGWPSLSKNCLYGFDAFSGIISEGTEGDTKYKPIQDPEFWGYYDLETMNTILATSSGMPVYTIPDADKSRVLVGETVLLTGESPLNSGV